MKQLASSHIAVCTYNPTTKKLSPIHDEEGNLVLLEVKDISNMGKKTKLTASANYDGSWMQVRWGDSDGGRRGGKTAQLTSEINELRAQVASLVTALSGNKSKRVAKQVEVDVE